MEWLAKIESHVLALYGFIGVMICLKGIKCVNPIPGTKDVFGKLAATFTFSVDGKEFETNVVEVTESSYSSLSSKKSTRQMPIYIWSESQNRTQVAKLRGTSCQTKRKKSNLS